MGKKTFDHAKNFQHGVRINTMIHAYKDNGQTDLKTVFVVQSTDEKLFTIINNGLSQSETGTNNPIRKQTNSVQKHCTKEQSQTVN